MDPRIFEGSLPAIAWLISYFVQKARWSTRVNTTIAASTLLGAAVATVFLQGRLTGDIMGDVVLVVGTATALQAESMAPLNQWLRVHLSIPTTGQRKTPPPSPPVQQNTPA